MANSFQYEGRDSSGGAVSGVLKASSTDDVVAYLERRGVVPLDIKATKQKEVASGFLRNFLSFNLGLKKVNVRDIMDFCRQLSTLNNAGVPLIKAITQLSQSSTSRILGKTLADVAEDISSGMNLTNAMKKHSDVFSPIVTNVIEVGESTGHLDDALAQLGNYLETTIANRRRLMSAIRYPSFIIVAIFAAMVMMNFFVIPKFSAIFSKFKLDLPIATRIIMGSSDFMVKYWLVLTIIFVCMLFGGYRLLKIPKVRYYWDKYKLSMPIFGVLQKRIILAQFSWTFGLILRSGVPVIKGVALAGNSTDNAFFSKQILVMRDAIDHGESFSQAATTSGLFTPTIIQMMEVGEESGKLDEILTEVAKYYEAEVDYDLRRLNELIEPILLTIIGIMVLILALGIYFPLWDLIKVVKI